MTKNTITIQPKDAPITRVTVYNDRANVTRIASPTLEQGVQRVVFDNLPYYVDTNSIRVDGRGEAVILEVSHKTLYHGNGDEKQRDEEKETIQKEINDIKDQLAKVDNWKERLNHRSKLLENTQNTIHNTINQSRQNDNNNNDNNKYNNVKEGLAHVAVAAQQQQQQQQGEGENKSQIHHNLRRFLQWYSKERRELDDSLRSAEEEKERLDEEKSKLEARQHQLQIPLSNTGVRGYSVVVTVDSTQDENQVELSLEYMVTNASWKASYDMRFDSAENSFVITYHGVIKQNTNEDWRNVELSLSTAQPSLGGYPPDLDTIYVGIARPPVFRPQAKKRKKGFSMGGFGARSGSQQAVERRLDSALGSSLVAMEEVDESMEAEPINVATTAVSKGVTSSTFGISRPATIPADNLPHKVVIADHLSFENAVFSYKTVPRRVEKAFLKVKSKNETDYDFLAGEVSVFFDGSFVVNSYISDVMVNQEFKIFVGADPSIAINYKPVVRQQENKGVLRGHKRATVKRMTVVTNHKNVAAKISVVDLVPQSNQRDISIDHVEPHFTEKSGEFEDYQIPNNDMSIIADKLKLSKQGFITWKTTIPAGESAYIPLKYKVQWPNGKELQQSDF